MIHANEPTETDRLAARAALQLGVLRLFDNGLGFVSPTLCELTGRDLEHGVKVARHCLEHWAAVTLAARRNVQAGYFARTA